EVRKRHLRQIQHLRAPAFALAIHPILVILPRAFLDAALGFRQHFLAASEDDRVRRANRCAGGLQALRQALLAEFTLHDVGIEALPLEFGNVIGAGNLAISAADAHLGIPCDHARLYIFAQALEHATRDARRIDAVHALLLHIGVRFSIRWLIQLDDVLGGA